MFHWLVETPHFSAKLSMNLSHELAKNVWVFFGSVFQTL